jgi:predicted Zn-dependent protease
MTNDRVAGAWHLIKGKAKEQWGKLTAEARQADERSKGNSGRAVACRRSRRAARGEAVMLQRSVLTRLVCVSLTSVLAPITGTAAEPQADQQLQQEQQLGTETFNELKAKREIIATSPLYDSLKPLASDITRAAQPRYGLPIKFYLVHEPQPNAFATPGGNVYVVDELLYFVKNDEELAGTICHELAHTIHHDSMELAEKQKKIMERELGAAVVLGPTAGHALAIALLGKLHSLSYSRDVEARADLTGADICAAAGHNPWGLVWLFREFKNARPGEMPSLLSDHPDDQERIDALTQHFAANPAVFGRFNQDPKSGTAFLVQKNAPVVFLR